MSEEMATPEHLSDAEKPPNGAFSLENILGADHENLEHPRFREDHLEEDSEETELPAAEGFCIECEGCSILLLGRWAILTEVFDADQPAQVFCESCSDNYCEVCFAAQHRKGTRKEHVAKPLTLRPVKKVKENGDAKVEKEDEDSVSSLNFLSPFDLMRSRWTSRTRTRPTQMTN